MVSGDERRYYGLDALRGGMMMLGIVLHAAEFYIAAPPPALPMPTDRNTSYVFDLVFHFIHSFRMPTFFVLAGFFASLLVEKRGIWGTYKNRAARILAPFAAGMVTVVPLSVLFFFDLMLTLRFGTRDWIPNLDNLEILGGELRAKGLPAGEPSPLHLWFLYYLLYFYLLIPPCAYLARRSAAVRGGIRKFLASPVALLVLGLYTAATLWPYRGAQVHEGFIFFRPHLPSLVYYGSFFVFGYLFHHHRDVLRAFVAHLRLAAALAAFLFPLSLYLSYLENTGVQPYLLVHCAAVVAHGLCTWALIYVFIGAALRYFDYDAPWILYVSQSSYWVFLVHLPIVIFACWWLLQYDVAAELKFLASAGFTTILCFVSYHYLVQRTWVSVFLNGKRFDLDWPWLAQPRAIAQRAE
jgi:peptidoglycan/LPS O-acetylase OafA/YrhL